MSVSGLLISIGVINVPSLSSMPCIPNVGKMKKTEKANRYPFASWIITTDMTAVVKFQAAAGNAPSDL
jgi:hypothetical protein